MVFVAVSYKYKKHFAVPATERKISLLMYQNRLLFNMAYTKIEILDAKQST